MRSQRALDYTPLTHPPSAQMNKKNGLDEADENSGKRNREGSAASISRR